MKNKKLMLLILLLLGVGFAAVSTTLLMTGNVNISTYNADFDVRFTKAVLDGVDITSTAIIENGKKIIFETNDLSIVGDMSKLDFEVINNSAMYDSEVSMECVVDDANKEYYQISKEAATLIPAKATEVGKIEVKLIKASIDDRKGTFKCTLNVIAKEKTSKARYIPKYFEFGDPTTSSTQDYMTLKYPDTEISAKVFAGLDENGSQKSVCIVKHDNIECFKNNNLKFEIEHLKDVFGESNCTFDDSSSNCYSADFGCYMDFYGGVYCSDNSLSFHCTAHSDNTVSCEGSSVSE